MKIFSWLGAIVLFLAVAFGTASVLRQNPTTSLASNRTVAAAAQAEVASGVATRVATPSSSPTASPKPRPSATRPVAAAPVRRAVPQSTAVVIVSTQQALINQDRARYGLRPLKWSSCLASIAYSNALRMANQGFISHTNGPTRDLGCGLGYHAGENVGYWSGGGLTQVQLDYKLNTMFMNSPDHRANILSSYYRYVGTAWKTGANGAHYIAVEFS
jgi:uncharacterized protein YkwD